MLRFPASGVAMEGQVQMELELLAGRCMAEVEVLEAMAPNHTSREEHRLERRQVLEWAELRPLAEWKIPQVPHPRRKTRSSTLGAWKTWRLSHEME